jgi:predicted CoA-binding protein
MERIQDFLAHKRFAFIGVSRQPKDFSRALFREFRARGYAPVPVHPEAAEIDGLSCFARLQDVQPPVDSVLLITSPGATDGLVQECASAGIERIWLYRGTGQGAVTPSAVTFCEANGISVIPGECPFMFFDGTPLVHRVHGLARKILGAYPR